MLYFSELFPLGAMYDEKPRLPYNEEEIFIIDYLVDEFVNPDNRLNIRRFISSFPSALRQEITENPEGELIKDDLQLRRYWFQNGFCFLTSACPQVTLAIIKVDCGKTLLRRQKIRYEFFLGKEYFFPIASVATLAQVFALFEMVFVRREQLERKLGEEGLLDNGMEIFGAALGVTARAPKHQT